MTQEKQQKADDLAEKIIRLAQSTLVMEMRFFDVAAFRLRPVPQAGITAAVNGRVFYYDSWYVLAQYRRDPKRINRMFLHALLHCLLGHLYRAHQADRGLWDLSADIAVEALIGSLSLETFQTDEEKRQSPVIEELSEELQYLTAERIYDYYRRADLREDEIFALQQMFCMDAHDLWYEPAGAGFGEERTAGAGDAGDTSADRKSGASDGRRTFTDPKKGAGSAPGEDSGHAAGLPDSRISDFRWEEHTGGRNAGEPAQSREEENAAGADAAGSMQQRISQAARQRRFVNEREDRREWEKISRRMKTDLEMRQRQQGSTPGSLLQDLEYLHRDQYDYRDFLQKFTAVREEPGVDPEEFDYGLYTYGLEMYGDTPLVEPLESRQQRSIRDFVIAIDTSGSVGCELVQAFLQKTYNILKTSGTFSSQLNLYLLQCDSAIQKIIHITSQRDLDRCLSGMKIRGFGGTDFRPVFTFVEDMRKKGELKDLKGLLYFTDGYGTFPLEKPPYETAFVFIRKGVEDPQVPPWAVKVMLDQEELA